MARAKLMASLPAGAAATRIATRFHLDATGWFHATEPVAHLPVVARAVFVGLREAVREMKALMREAARG